MTPLVTNLLFSALAAGIARWCGSSKKLAILFGIVSTVVIEFLFWPFWFMRVRDGQGGFIPHWQLFAGGITLPVFAVVIAVILTKRKKPNQTSEPTAPSGRGSP